MATHAKLPPPPSQNGVITGPPKGAVGGNRKKQKRRAKQAAKVAAESFEPLAAGQSAERGFDEDPLGYGEEDDYEDSDGEPYDDHYSQHRPAPNGYGTQPATTGKKKKKKSKANSAAHQHSAYNPDLVGGSLPHLSAAPASSLGALRPNHGKGGHGDIWNTSTQQERQNIKDFWLSLSEDERKSLLKIEKEAVLRKMKQQQKHSCSCTVCGRKRTAIEEELEVLYEGYYEELEQYAHHDQPPNLAVENMMPDPLQHRKLTHPLAAPPPNPTHKISHLHEHLDDEDFSEDEEYSDEEDYSDDGLSSPIHARSAVPDFFTFGQNLTVKGILTPWLEKLQSGLKGNADNILTVADDLLKNDGRKFIEMMEQLAERRMQRESEAEYAATNPGHPGGYGPGDPGYNHDDPLAAGDDFDDDEASYDSQEEYDDELDEEDEMGGLTEEQRMQEGRRMFQIFAARMFEQRVLTAYKEKVAAERQQKLLEELEDETKLEAQREAKKQRDAQKKKDKKKQQQAAKAEEKARKEAEKAAEEARIREAEEKKQEEQRRRKEEQRRKREEEKRKQDEDRARKEADKARRQQEEQQKREEAERKAREQKAAEKAKKDEAKRKEREEREAREKEARDKEASERKAQEDKERRTREADARAKADKEMKPAQQRAPSSTSQPQQISKRPSQAGMVAVPGSLPRQTTSGGPSPHPSIAMPAVPKAPTPATTRQRQTSQQGSHGSSPKQSHSQVSSVPSKSSSPNNISAPQNLPPPSSTGPPKILQKAGNQQFVSNLSHAMQPPNSLHQPPIQPPPGMQHPQQHPGGFGGMSSMGYPGFQGPHQGPQNPMLHGNIGSRSSMPMFPQQAPPMGVQNRFGPPGLNGPPSGVVGQGGRLSYPYDAPGAGQLPPGFGPPQPPVSQHPNHQTSPIYQNSTSSMAGAEIHAPRPTVQSHSRQASMSERERFEPAVGQPIARPAPIQRPSSVKPHGDSAGDVDDLSKHLGSSALLDDTDDHIPPGLMENRRQSHLPPGPRPNVQTTTPLGSFGVANGFGPTWNTSGLHFAQGSGLTQQGWGNLSTPIMGSWPGGGSGFSTNGTFGNQIHRPPGAGPSRPLTIRQAVCQACKQLSMGSRGENDGYHDIALLVRQIENNRVPLEGPPTFREIEEICETEGDAQNGGGELHIRRIHGANPAFFAVKWEPHAGTPDQARGIGEIGSPLPSKSSPVGAGWGGPSMARFQNLG